MKKLLTLIAVCAGLGALGQGQASVTGTSGTVVFEPSPFPGASDDEIFVFDEQQGVGFVGSQTLEFGSIAPGTLVDSHDVQYDPLSGSGFVGTGSVTFDGSILGVVTSTDFLDQDLSADGAGTSDVYFGLAGSLSPYPTGANPASRGLGSPEDDLVVSLGADTLAIDSLEIPAGATAGNLDGFRVFTATSTNEVPTPSIFMLLALGFAGLGVAKAESRFD